MMMNFQGWRFAPVAAQEADSISFSISSFFMGSSLYALTLLLLKIASKSSIGKRIAQNLTHKFQI